MQYRTFGSTGLSVSALGFGTMRLPTMDEKAMGANLNEEESIRLIRHAIDEGVNYIDTADRYHEGNSECLVAKALADGYREKVYLADKSPVWLLETPEDFDRILDEQLKKCAADHFDFYLLHALNANTFADKVKGLHLVERMQQAKADGKIGHIGFSFHDRLPVFREILEYSDAWEFCQIQLNYVDADYQAGVEGMRMAAERGMGVIAMEPLLGGKLANPTGTMAERISPERPPVQWALDWLWNQPEVSMLLSGMGNQEQVEQNLAYADQSSVHCLSESDLAMLEGVHQAYLDDTRIPCTGCSYCVPCPQGLDIPELFAAYNSVVSSTKPVAQRKYAAFDVKASQCVKCGACEALCPQQLPISKHMKLLADFFE